MRILIAIALWLFSAAITAQVSALRSLPLDAKRGHLTHLQGNYVRVDGTPIRLAPGGLIRGQTNLIILPVSVPPDSLVKYKVDQNGDISAAWILTAEEAAQPDESSERRFLQ